jgi:hypothetical protein
MGSPSAPKFQKGNLMTATKNFDRWVLVIAALLFAAICVFGMYTHNVEIEGFGKTFFAGAWSALMLLLNRELIGSNGNGNGKTENPPTSEVSTATMTIKG